MLGDIGVIVIVGIMENGNYKIRVSGLGFRGLGYRGGC